MARLHLVDGTYELFRAHYSKRPGHVTPDGREVKATVGLATSMLALLQDRAEAVTHLAIAFDNPIRSFRNDLFGGYKSDEGVDPELRAQFDLAERATRALGLVTWSMKGHETDDALATAAHRFAGDFEQVRILTPDKDLLQCVRGRHVVQVDRLRGLERDEAAVVEAWGVPPSGIPEVLGLMGDTADGIPGLAGFGQKTAAAVVAAFGRLENIPTDETPWPAAVRGAPRHKATLKAGLADALLYRRLATLVTDVPLKETAAQLEFHGTPRAAWEAFCDELGLTSLKSRPKR